MASEQKTSSYFLKSQLVAALPMLVCFLLASTHVSNIFAEEGNAASLEQRLSSSVKYLASDDLGGRGVGEEGLDEAAEYIAEEFSKLGLKTELFNKTPFQEFTISVKSELGPKEKNHLTLVGTPGEPGGEPRRIPLELGKDFNTLAIGGSSQFDLPIVFAGYGITAKKNDYDDFDGIDVKDKAVLIIRKEPQQGNPHSVFDGTKASQHATFTRKIANAYEHGAAAVILVNDDYGMLESAKSHRKSWEGAVDRIAKVQQEFKKKDNPTPEETKKYREEVNKLADRIKQVSELMQGEKDKVLGFKEAGQSSGRKMPVFFCSRKSFEPVIESAFGERSLKQIEDEIDESLKPQSTAIMGWQVTGESQVIEHKAKIKNVIAVLEGEGPLADETVVVGAHYDHIGMGGTGSGSLAPWTRAIHNGADDNASGTAGLLEIARRFATAEKPPRRRIVFIAFTGEERGLLGSAKYVREPRFSLEKTVAMVNLDMIGRLKDDKVIIQGTKTAAEFDKLIDDVNETYKFKITKKPGGYGPSDHSSFYAKQIPVFHIFTGTHSDYHRPSDDFEKVNVEGMRRVTEMVGDIVASIVDSEDRPKYQEIKRPQMAARGGDRPYFGSIPDFSQEVEGYALMGVAKGGPAERAGMKSGDVIVQFGESKIGGLEDIDSALRKFKADDEVKVVILRDGKKMTITVTLDPPR